MDLSHAREAGFDDVILAANSHFGNADLAVQAADGTVSTSTAVSVRDDFVYEDYVVLPVASGGTAHAFVVPVGNTHADVTVLLSFHKDGDCVVPFKIAGLDKSVSDPSIIRPSDKPASIMMRHADPKPAPPNMDTLDTYQNTPCVDPGLTEEAQRIVDGIRKGSGDSEGENLMAKMGLERSVYRMGGKTHTLWKGKAAREASGERCDPAGAHMPITHYYTSYCDYYEGYEYAVYYYCIPYDNGDIDEYDYYCYYYYCDYYYDYYYDDEGNSTSSAGQPTT
ncbi:unnamed protein product [Vitrella brassicaformis CCMP3155]|uniref:Uncharacterized protein n=1 Tax=Vitrella brassicaformis (strain CCMP3155) TaxID=1169540 RepID=A0A0G4G212_VITBC|nr:unnamed protein product [Vitrella brassicaformis CCMP3155]|eukprot:CEM22010.1 unnamed protein product [Vitrella brassicaformis CCMP3155]